MRCNMRYSIIYSLNCVIACSISYNACDSTCVFPIESGLTRLLRLHFEYLTQQTRINRKITPPHPKSTINLSIIKNLLLGDELMKVLTLSHLYLEVSQYHNSLNHQHHL